ncbi:MAG: amidohydrolase family protein [Epsilonproteobacteria bacterium]|nr:hypothetical protein [Campylobacterota bacterium]NPA57075.1 amidohydrolase family protein [Campylobacterota bacterium]
MVYRNLFAIDPDGGRVVDIEVEGGVIRRVGKLEGGIDLQGSWVIPALVDLNLTPLDGRLNGENLQRLSEEGRKGGVGIGVLSSTTEPPLNGEMTLEFVKSQALEIDLYPALQGVSGEGLSEIATLAREFAVGITLCSDTRSDLLIPLFQYGKMLNLPLFVRLRNRALVGDGVMHEGAVSFELGLSGRSVIEEYSEVAKIIEFGEFYGVTVIFQGISTAHSLDLIAQSTYSYAEVPIHHLLNTDEACRGYNTLAKLDPPLRDREERERLLQALVDGKIDFLTSLHTPQSYTKKDLSFDEAAYGIDALSFYLPLAYTRLVKEGIISMERLLELTSANGAAQLGLRHGFIKCGYTARLIRFDPEGPVEGKGLYRDQEIYGTIEYL